jgi:hypothetical protein
LGQSLLNDGLSIYHFGQGFGFINAFGNFQEAALRAGS